MHDLHEMLIAGRMLGGSGGSPSPEPTLITKNITANGTYKAADDSADGYSAVTVNVPALPVTFLKSIKSLGNSIIITDFVPAYDWVTLADIMIGADISGGSPSGYLFGSMSYTNDYNTGAYSVGFDIRNNDLGFYLGENWTDSGNHYFSINENEKSKPSTAIARRGYPYSTFNDHSLLFTSTPTRTDCVTTFAIGGKHTNVPETVPYSGAEITYYGFKIFTLAGAMIHHLLPAKSKTTNRAGMYDLITGAFYPSDSNFDDFVTEAIT